MPRNMSFSLTTGQVRDRTKDVTRRLGWSTAKPGEIINACVKCMGLRPGQKVERICQIRVVSNTPEPLDAIGSYQDDVAREGFPGESPATFICRFCDAMQCDSLTTVNRIEFAYLAGDDWSDYPWPTWVPVKVRRDIQRFWSPRWGRTPAEWERSCNAPPHYQPTVGTRVSCESIGGRETFRGRWVPAWNNIGRVVLPDGSYHCSSTCALQVLR